jgi:regulator of cell morphogenesis and NO signaling
MSRYAMLPVGQLVRQRPSRARLFERFGIDYCCRGKLSLAEACALRGLDLKEVCDQLDATGESAQEAAAVDWSEAPLGDLIDHIVQTHHVYLRRELPRLEDLTAKVAAAHRAAHPELRELRQVFAALRNELVPHMFKEEHVLFPWIAKLEQEQQRPHGVCGSVNNPIVMMEHEHQRAGEALDRIRWLTDDYNAPPDACPAYVALLAGLAELEADLHLHIHKENNILFPRAAELEKSLTAKSPMEFAT